MRRFLITVDAVSYNVRVDFDLFDDNFPYNSDLSESSSDLFSQYSNDFCAEVRRA